MIIPENCSVPTNPVLFYYLMRLHFACMRKNQKYSQEQMFSAIESCQREGVPAKEYCNENQIPYPTHLNDGMLEIDNNLAENSIRSITLGRKNYLFAGSDR